MISYITIRESRSALFQSSLPSNTQRKQLEYAGRQDQECTLFTNYIQHLPLIEVNVYPLVTHVIRYTRPCPGFSPRLRDKVWVEAWVRGYNCPTICRQFEAWYHCLNLVYFIVTQCDTNYCIHVTLSHVYCGLCIAMRLSDNTYN